MTDPEGFHQLVEPRALPSGGEVSARLLDRVIRGHELRVLEVPEPANAGVGRYAAEKSTLASRNRTSTRPSAVRAAGLPLLSRPRVRDRVRIEAHLPHGGAGALVILRVHRVREQELGPALGRVALDRDPGLRGRSQLFRSWAQLERLRLTRSAPYNSFILRDQPPPRVGHGILGPRHPHLLQGG